MDRFSSLIGYCYHQNSLFIDCFFNVHGNQLLIDDSNWSQVVDLCKQLDFSMVNVGGLDVVDGNKKIILAITWQLMRCVCVCARACVCVHMCGGGGDVCVSLEL